MGKILLRHFLIAFILEEFFVRVVLEHTSLRSHPYLCGQVAASLLIPWGIWTTLKIRESKQREALL
jgi:hypothetical protein